MHSIKQAITRAVEVANTFGFALIIGSIIYFIIGNVVGLVHGNILEWTFCGTMHRVGIEWCGIGDATGEASIDHFFHHLATVTTLPWFMMFWGIVLTGLSTVLLKFLGYRYRPPGSSKG